MSYRGTRRAELIAARRCTWSTSVLVLRTEQFSSRKSSILQISKLSRLFLQWFLLGSRVRAHTVRCASRLTVRSSKSLSASCTTFLSKKKKKRTTICLSQNPRTIRKKRFLQEQATGELETVTRWPSFTVFSIAKLYEQGRALVRMPRL